MAYVPERRRPTVPSYVLEQLSVLPGPVNDVFMVSASQYRSPDGIFKIMHTIIKVLNSPVTFAINYSSEAEVFIRCTDPIEAEGVDASRVAFKFDDHYVRFYKLASISRMPPQHDTASFEPYKIFPAHYEFNDHSGYPKGFSDAFDDIDHKNPALSNTALKILGLEEGPVTDVVKACVKYQQSPREYMLALRTTSFRGRFKFVVDRDGGLYLRFNLESEAEMQSMFHNLILNNLVKFYKVETVRKLDAWEDKSVSSHVESRAEGQQEGYIVWNTVD